MVIITIFVIIFAVTKKEDGKVEISNQIGNSEQLIENEVFWYFDTLEEKLYRVYQYASLKSDLNKKDVAKLKNNDIIIINITSRS